MNIPLIVILGLAIADNTSMPIVWRTDYTGARAESQKKNIPLLIFVVNQKCKYCEKMNQITFADPNLAALMRKTLPLKLDGVKHQKWIETMNIQLYPTTIFAFPDGRFEMMVGYHEPDEFGKWLAKMMLRAQQPVELTELERLRKENAELRRQVQAYRLEGVRQELALKEAMACNERLLDVLRGLADPKHQIGGDPNKPNPPSEQVDGKIEKVDGDIVLINLGADQGLRMGNTLDVYRREPEAKYLGVIRIMEARPTQSVARLIAPAAPKSAAKLLPGDLVTSKVMLQKKRTEKPDEKTK
jgi:hypothetical protein